MATANGCSANGFLQTGEYLAVDNRIRSRGSKALDLLLEARHYANLLGHDACDFALDFRALCSAGLSINDLRWLMCRHLLEHVKETTLAGDERRRFTPLGAMAFDRASCFTLSQAGVEFVLQPRISTSEKLPMLNGEASTRQSSDARIPTWDEQRQELRLGDKVVKRFTAPARNQQLILAAFEEEGWPTHVDDPLPPGSIDDPKRRLHDTIVSLNRHQQRALLRFAGDGKGEGIRWELVAAKGSNGLLD